jgi:outer membrane protein TolC
VRNIKRGSTIFILCCLLHFSQAKAQVIFTSVDSLLAYATARSINLQTGNIKLQQAHQAKLAAALNIPEITGGASFSYTNNTKLPVNLFPAETFGGQPGTFREIQTGVQYVTHLNENIEVKLVNLKGWENFRLAKLNILATSSDNQLTLKTLHNNIAATYFNIVSLQQQYLSTLQNIAAADTLLQVVKQKYLQGLVKQQDINDAQVSLLNNQSTAEQIQYAIAQQYLALKLLSDIPESDSISISQPITAVTQVPAIAISDLAVQNSLLKEKVAWSNYKQYKYSLYPTLSFFQSATTQQYNTRGKWFDGSVRWIPSSYIGLRLNIPLPSANALAQVSKAKYDYRMAQKTTEQQKIKTGLEAQQLLVDFNKAAAQVSYNQQLYQLQADTYQKNRNLYKEGLIGLDQTISGFNAMANSHYNLIAAQVSVLLAKAKIDINNNIR